MELSALRHRPESEDCFVYTDSKLHLRLHTKRGDVVSVKVLYGDPYWMHMAGSKPVFDYSEKSAKLIGHGQASDYWEAVLTAPYHRLQYLFEVTGVDGDRWLFGDRGVRAASEANRTELSNYFRVPYLHEIDRVKTPDWAKKTVWYQIFPERFANGDSSNDPAGTKPWSISDHPGRDDYYGGDLQGVLDHLDDLQKLGVNGLYFCPIFTASSNHKYDTIDYLEIDPAFGNKALFKKLVDEAHARGMKIMLDAVFNHLGSASPQWQDVVKNGSKSKYADWFHIYEFPVLPYRDPTKGQANPQFDSFAFGPGMPKLNTANSEVQDFLLNIATYWVREFDIDAWRLDVANEVDHHFWRRFRSALDAIKSDFYIVGEVWHSSQPWLNGDQFSGVMNYSFTQQIEDHFLTGTQSAPDMLNLLTDQLMLYRNQVDQVMLNTLDTHDTPRIKTVAGENEDKALQALAFMFMQTGAPCIYYGTEMGMSGAADPDNRKPMDWSKLGGSVWKQVHELVAFRRAHAQTLGQGTTQFSITKDGLIQVTRIGQETVSAWFNTTTHPIKLPAKASIGAKYDGKTVLPLGYLVTSANIDSGNKL